MVKALMSEKNALQKKEAQWQQERQSLIEQFKLALDRQFAKRSEALKPYNEAQGDLFNEAECEAAKVIVRKPCSPNQVSSYRERPWPGG